MHEVWPVAPWNLPTGHLRFLKGGRGWGGLGVGAIHHSRLIEKKWGWVVGRFLHSTYSVQNDALAAAVKRPAGHTAQPPAEVGAEPAGQLVVVVLLVTHWLWPVRPLVVWPVGHGGHDVWPVKGLAVSIGQKGLPNASKQKRREEKWTEGGEGENEVEGRKKEIELHMGTRSQTK